MPPYIRRPRTHFRQSRGGRSPAAVTRGELASRTLDPKTLKPVLTVLIGPDSDVGQAMGGRKYLRPRTLFKQWIDAMPPGTMVAEVVSHLSAPPGEPLSTAHAVRMLKLALEYNIPAILSNAVRYCAQDAPPPQTSSTPHEPSNPFLNCQRHPPAPTNRDAPTNRAGLA